MACRIAIDGPAASGKSAVGSAVASQLRYLFLDTGIMYRAFAWLTLREHVGPADAVGLTALVASTHMDLCPSEEGPGILNRVLVNGIDATPYLRDSAVEASVSIVSAVSVVRQRMVEAQRKLARSSIVMAGRDIGTVVLTDAELKIYLDASAEERARRRLTELQQHGDQATFDDVLADIVNRDKRDTSRADSPLTVAEDAERIETDRLGLEEVIQSVLRLAEGRDCFPKDDRAGNITEARP